MGLGIVVCRGWRVEEADAVRGVISMRRKSFLQTTSATSADSGWLSETECRRYHVLLMYFYGDTRDKAGRKRRRLLEIEVSVGGHIEA